MAQLDRWLDRISKEGEVAWRDFYQETFRHEISDVPRFLRAVDNYGADCVFNAIVASSDKKFLFSGFSRGDPLNYVLAVTRRIWDKEQQERHADSEYARKLEESRERSLTLGTELEEKIKKARENVRATRQKI